MAATYTAGKGKAGSRAVKRKTPQSKKSGAAYRGGMIDTTIKNLRRSSKKGMDY